MERYNDERTKTLREIITEMDSNEHRTIITETNRIMVTEQYISSTSNDSSTNCKQFVTNNESRQLFQEISSNLQNPINATALYNKIGQKKQDHRHIFMTKHNLGLTDPEFIAIILWSSSSQLTKQYHIDCGNNNASKWKLFINALTNGIEKISQAVIINNLIDKKEHIFFSIPSTLYRGTKHFDPNCETWNLDTILSFTASSTVAETFAALGVDEETEGKPCVLSVNKLSKYVINGEFITAPINWLSLYDYEQEWIILPSVKFKVNEDNTTITDGCTAYQLSPI